MDANFIYDRFVTGKNFIGRRFESSALSNLLESAEDVALYEPPKSGKMSLIQNTLFNMRLSGKLFVVGLVNIFNIRTVEDFLVKFGSAVIRPVASSQSEFEQIVAEYLQGTHFVFDPMRYAAKEEIVSVNWEIDDNDILQMMRLPQRIAAAKSIPYYMIISEFQTLMMADGYERVFNAMEQVLADKDKLQRLSSASFILSGSMVNAMKYIFEEKKYFYRKVEHLPLSQVDDKEIIEYIVRGFRSTGKVIERELLQGACSLFKCNLWYLNHFTAISDSMSKGYLNESILTDALKAVIAVNEPRFIIMVNDLTDHQLSLLKAVLDGVVRLSSSEVIEKYALNSSANVRRVKDALKKKEIITFNQKDEPMILDPLFEYWVSSYYFERND